jgi:hypothetical protein
MAVVQRFGGALKLNVHVHALMMDGVFARAGEGVAFVPGAPDAWAEEAPILAGFAAASVRGTLDMGPRAGARVRRCGDPADAEEPARRGRCQARQDGFDLQARVRVPADRRARLERLCRYALRPPVSQ